jgi:geranylgeranylglycerol-phosphate geranylgeranyltransferase
MERMLPRGGPALELARPQNGLIAGASVLVGAAMAGWQSSVFVTVVATLAAILITGGANALNDAFDIGRDRVNKPHRPLPSGRATRQEALLLSAVLFGAGLVGSAVAGTAAFLIAAPVSIALAGYAALTDLRGIAGNLIVSGAAALALVYGAIVGGDAGAGFFPALFAFLLTLGREIVKDAEDVQGDRRTGVPSLAIVAGREVALRAAATTLLILLILTPLPFVFGWYRLPYLFGVLIVDLILIVSAVSLVRDPPRRRLGRISYLLKIAIAVGVVALFIGR